MARALFFDTVRSTPFGGYLTVNQVRHMDAFLDEAARLEITDEQTAYVFGTAFHETGRKIQPVTENLNYTSASRLRAVWPSRFKSNAEAQPYVRNPKGLAIKVYGDRMGNRPGTEDGWTYRGRGQVQITGRSNYERASDKLGADLLGDPDRALDPVLSARILFAGMNEGWFTGKKLPDYIREGACDYVNARRIVNATDQATKIADYAQCFEAALKAAGGVPGCKA